MPHAAHLADSPSAQHGLSLLVEEQAREHRARRRHCWQPATSVKYSVN